MTAQARIFTPHEGAQAGRAQPVSTVGSEVFRRLGIPRDRGNLVKQVQRGFRVAVVEKLASELRVPQQTVLKVAKIAPATLTRRRRSASGLLSPEESDRMYRIAAAYRSALQLFQGDADSARGWLNEPAKALGGDTPLQYLNTEAGASAVYDLIGRLEHGVYT